MKESVEKKENEETVDRHAKNIPSKQDKRWVGMDQMPQEQFDKTEFEDREAEKHPGKKRCH